jgi:hypothetical protein
MRNLSDFEMEFVSGAGCGCSPCPPAKKGNNGFGNGADANLAAPGGSGKTGGGKEGSVGDARGPR